MWKKSPSCRVNTSPPVECETVCKYNNCLPTVLHCQIMLTHTCWTVQSRTEQLHTLIKNLCHHFTSWPTVTAACRHVWLFSKAPQIFVACTAPPCVHSWAAHCLTSYSGQTVPQSCTLFNWITGHSGDLLRTSWTWRLENDNKKNTF